MLPNLDDLVTAGVLTNFDRYFARRLASAVRETVPEVLLGAALASRAVAHGHVCVDLKHLAGSMVTDALLDKQIDFSLPEPEKITKKLAESQLISDGSKKTPLVLARNRLYLSRYWQYENKLVHHLLGRADKQATGVDQQLLAEGLDRLFVQKDRHDASAQRHAAELAVKRMLTIVSGGPGTGKTTTIVKILALLQEQAIANSKKPLDILLLAPTGKAAARLTQSVQDKIAGLNTSVEVQQSIPNQASTIHRALGYQPRNPTRFRFNSDYPLTVDAVFVDEASMVDIALMAKLFDAVPHSARLILLGDHHQLASVEAGSILGDIYEAAQQGEAGLADCVAYLDKSFRFDSSRGIGALNTCINSGKGDNMVSLLHDEKQHELTLKPFAEQIEFDKELADEILQGYGHFMKAANPREALQRFERFRVLCAHRQGLGGVEHLNAFAEDLLRRAGLIADQGAWYKGRPVMITANNYSMRLFNGDVGMVWPDPVNQQVLKVFFAGSTSEELRSFMPSRLPPHETVYAMTIHKSQGSEFDNILIVLPQETSPILTRELIYTAVSRARTKVTIFASEDILRNAISRKIERASGLIDKLSLRK